MKNRLTGYRTIGRGAATVLAMLALVLTLSSMNAAAAGAGDKGSRPSSPALTQYFQDVPVGNFYYAATAALYTNGVVSGYTCGVAPAGPCVPPDNLPYYLPSNTVTRGQMSFYVQNVRTHPGINIDASTGPYSGTTAIDVYMTGTASVGQFTENYGSGYGDSYGSGAQGVVGWAAGDYSSGLFGYGAGTTHSYGVFGYSVNNAGGYFSSTTGSGIVASANNGYAGQFYSGSGYGLYVASGSSDAGDFYGADWGLYVRNSGTHPAVDASTSGASSYGGLFQSTNYVALNAAPPASNNGYVQMLVTGVDPSGALNAARINNGGLYVAGNLTVGGSKTGYVVDAMQNADSVALQPGDVVVIAENSTTPVLGDIPVPAIKLATSANDSGVVGVVDAPLYVPDAVTAATYKAQQDADVKASQAAAANQNQKLSPLANIPNRITDEQGLPHQDNSVSSVAPGKYCNVVTLGAYKAVKVDASFGPVHPGDLLTTSPHAGYAMVVKDKAAAYGAVIGKALSGLDSGTGTVTVMVSLK